MSTTETQIVEMLRQLPEPALDEVKVFLNSLLEQYQQQTLPVNKGMDFIDRVKGTLKSGMTTDEVMALTRGEDD